MALVNASLQVSVYTDDFGNTYENVPIKFGDTVDAKVITTMGYTARAGGVICSGNLPFAMRHLVAVFADGSTNMLPVAKRSDIPDLVGRLIGLKAVNNSPKAAVCVSLVGEKWNLLTAKVYGNAEFKTTAYDNIPSSGKKTSYRFTYNSDVLSGNVQLSTAIEIAPSDLHDCQKAGLGTVETGAGICSGASLGLKGRHYVIQALAKKSGETEAKRRVTRQAIVAAQSAVNIKAVIASIDGCAFCLGYMGESVVNVHNLVAKVDEE
ncbi:hypothetical protein C7H19_23680 [Aphanothece hegewaldii CCALA 016]|uniref:Uncharacterized protein n=1 Tax=Aphanothece hegewaldii CCALA 016 TaxID=2107694 RepID=A0A2T1LR37_9CHRO|nr:hypothetical protein [Aphanothece hegewaldii]PSF30585.1 hypothetical protein C7H19_23680 [Aphanothece hegewaldii CCALA 016]